MKSMTVFAFATCLGLALSVTAGEATVLARMALDLRGEPTFHFVDVFVSHNKSPWIYPEIIYADFGTTGYSELFAGIGYKSVLQDGQTDNVRLLSAIRYGGAFGNLANGQRWLQPYFQLDTLSFGHVRTQSAFFTQVPLVGDAPWKFVLERAKLEYDFGRMKFGVGYAGVKVGDSVWTHRPFLTGTFKTPTGPVELWWQKIPTGSQFQLRLVF